MKYIFDIPDNVDYGVLTCRTSNGYYEYNFDGADLKQLPPAQPEPKRGKWVLVCDNNGMHFICNKCGAWRYHQEQKFCGECGADMREVTS